MKLIRVFMIFVLISLICGVGSAFNGTSSNQAENEITTKELSTEIVDNSFSKSIVEISQNEDDYKSVVEEVMGEVVEKETIIENQQNNEEKESTKTVEEKKEEIKQTVEKKNNEKSTIVVDEKKEVDNSNNVVSKVWEELGISEYDYYNSPMMKWQKVTHKTFEECQVAGEEATEVKINPETKEEYQEYEDYWCYGVNSYSGDFIGVMLKLSP